MAPGTSSPQRYISNLRRGVRLLRGKTCWGVAAGQGTGSNVKLEFGERVPRKTRVRNPFLSSDQQQFEGEFDLFVECAWRLDQNRIIVCGWRDSNENDGPMVRGLSKLRNQVVVNVELGNPIPDLVLHLSSELVLRVFCDQTNASAGNDNYSVRIGETIWAIGLGGAVSHETRRAH